MTSTRATHFGRASVAPVGRTSARKEDMSEDEPFLRAILADPEDRASRLVYAAWLDDRADPRAEYLRLQARVAGMPPGQADLPGLRRRLRELQAGLPPWWVA